MSMEFYSSRKILWDNFVQIQWQPPIHWTEFEGSGMGADDERRREEGACLHRIFCNDLACVHAYSGRPQYEDADATVFEVFGSSHGLDGSLLLQQIAKRFNVSLLQQYWEQVITPDEIAYINPEYWKGHKKLLDEIKQGIQTWNLDWR